MKMVKRSMRIVKYNGVVLQVVHLVTNHAHVQGKDRWNWSLRFLSGGVETLGVRQRLLENGKRITGLETPTVEATRPMKVVSQCALKVFAGEWSFWTEELTEMEMLREELREIVEEVES